MNILEYANTISAEYYTLFNNSNIDYGVTTNAIIGIGAVFALVIVILLAGLFSIICMWVMYNKANKPGWGSIVPFYNIYLLNFYTHYN